MSPALIKRNDMPKILIADDSIAVRKVAERLLTEAGMGVTLAANGTEALALLCKDRPDLIVSDVIMPDKSGYEVCAFIRAQAGLADLPVLLISGIVNDEVSRQADSCKADGVLKKPFQGTSLKDRVLELLMKRPSKLAAVPEPRPMARQEPPVRKESSAPMSYAQEAHDQGAAKTQVAQQANEVPSVTCSEPDVMPAVESAQVLPSVTEVSGESTISKDVADRHARLLAERDARIMELEETLACERRQNHEQIQQLKNALEEQGRRVAELDSRTRALDHALAEERSQKATLAEQLAEASSRTRRMEELETKLADTHRRMEEFSQLASDNVRNKSRILELEAHLTAERSAASQLVQQITTLEHVEGRVHELETTLASEREQAEVGRKQSALFEALAARVPDLEQACERERARIAEVESLLATERETAALVATQVRQLEAAVHRAEGLDLALADERERSAQLMKRATEAEHMAEQSNRRFEDMVRKLGEIAGLASQLGSGKR
jgi:CheY-like chemotaxis protein